MISNILNELIENVYKYSVKNSDIIVSVTNINNILELCSINTVSNKSLESYKKFVDKISNSKDIKKVYFDQIENRIQNRKVSRLGLLTILNDYPATFDLDIISRTDKIIELSSKIVINMDLL